jgi:hypothetical protein
MSHGSRMDWRRVAERRRTQRQGVEDVKGAAPFMASLIKESAFYQPTGKAELRKQAANAFMTWREKHMSEPREGER